MSRARDDAFVIGLLAGAHGTSHFFQLLIAPLFPFIRDALGVSYAALGAVVAALYTMSAVCQPLAGFVVDRYGARRVLLAGLALQVLGALLAGTSSGYASLLAGAAIIGLGNSVYHPADFAILNRRVETRRLGYAYSAHGVAGSLGYAAAPVFGVGVAAFAGWHVAVLSGAAVGFVMLALLLANVRRIDAGVERRAAGQGGFAGDARVLLAAPVVMCFLYFAVYAGGLSGLQSFGVAAMTAQFSVAATLASSALTAYMVGSASGILAGGFVATRTLRHDLVAAGGLAAGASLILLVATSAVPGSALPVALGFAGFAVGMTGPSRDMIVRGSTPPGSTGKVYGFVYSGLDVGSLSMPVFYGWLMDRGLASAVFYTVFALTALAIFTVLQLPGSARARYSA